MKQQSTVWAVVSGKGGVGKSVVSVNLAETLVDMGYNVALVDVDLGQSACAVLLNEQVEASAVDVVRRVAAPERALHRTRAGLTLVQAAADPGVADAHQTQLFQYLDQLLDELRARHDFVLLDAPAGLDGAVRWALDRATRGLLVLVGEPTAIADAYRLAKLVWQFDAEYPLYSVVNFAQDADEARSVAERFNTLTDYFTGKATYFSGWVPFSASVRFSVAQQTPAVRTPGPVQEAFRHLAANLAGAEAPASRSVAE